MHILHAIRKQQFEINPFIQTNLQSLVLGLKEFKKRSWKAFILSTTRQLPAVGVIKIKNKKSN